VGIGGAQVYFGVRPDITTLGKIVGGGLPIGVFGGRREIMELISPEGPVYQAGTFSGNPLSLSAGIATIDWLNAHPEAYSVMRLQAEAIRDAIPPRSGGSFVMIGSMFKYFFRSSPPANYAEIKQCDTKAFGEFWKKMLCSGVFIPPSQFETNFLSAVHTEEDLTQITDAYAKALG
jgi:glutamate-1-semialdehyde 2,1-aminomutase